MIMLINLIQTSEAVQKRSAHCLWGQTSWSQTSWSQTSWSQTSWRLPAAVLALTWAFGSLLGVGSSSGQIPPPDAEWTSNAILDPGQAATIQGVGAAQGISFHRGKYYIYGDVYTANPRVGVIKELNTQLQPTGRVLTLTQNGQPKIVHPTGLTFDDQLGCFLGDTVNQKATIYKLDWEKAWDDGNLDRAVLAQVTDDAAVNGCRPQFVTLEGKRWLATADYGDVRPEIRLYDPAKLMAAGRSSAPGVIGGRVLCGPFNQNLHWDAQRKNLICVQNVVAGRGWQLDVLNLAKAIADGRADGPGVRVAKIVLPPHTELEGYCPSEQQSPAEGFSGISPLGVFVTAHPQDNLATGTIRKIKPQRSPQGFAKYSFEDR